MAFTKVAAAGIGTGGVYQVQDLDAVGVVTASSFVGPLTGNSTGLSGTPNIVAGVVTATTFIGDGSGLTGVTASGSGINVRDTGATVGVAATIDFGTNVNVSPASAGIVTVTVGDTDLEIVDKIVHTGNTNTALRFPADNTVTVETNGSEALRVDSSGNIGVGSTQPTALLDVNGTLNVSGVSTFAGAIDANGDLDVDGHTELDNLNVSGVSTVTDLTVTGNLTVQGTTTTLDTVVTEVDKLEVDANNTTVGVAITQSGTGDILRLYDGATEVFSVIDGGKVGINKENPSAALSAYHATNNTVGIFESGDSVARVTFLDPGGQAHVGNEGDDLVLSVTSAASEALRIDSSGNIGIGTDDPQNNLEICDSNNPYKKISINPSVSVNTPASNGAVTKTIDFVGNNTGGLTEIGVIRWRNLDGGSEYTAASIASFNDGANSDGNLVFNIADGGTQAEALRITSSGSVGIGVTDPQTLLQISGTNASTRITLARSDVFRNNFIGLDGDADELVISADEDNQGSDSHIRFKVDGSEAVRINSSGYVGIASDIPEFPLDIGKHDGQGVVARFGNKTGGAVAITINDGGGNANVTFNHTDEIPGQDGSSGRIHCAVDGTTAFLEFELADNVTAGVKPTVTSLLQLRTNYIVSTQEHRFSNGISFDGGTNVLDDYEEGTLTLSVNDNSSNTGNSGSGTFNGYYTKIGNMVQVSIDLANIDTTGMTGTNVFYIFGLPYNVESLSGNQRFTSAVAHELVTYQASATNIVAFAQDNTNYIRLLYQKSGANSTLVDCGDLTSGTSDIRFNLWYQTGA